MSDSEGSGRFPEHDGAPGGEPAPEAPTGTADAAALPSETMPAAPVAGPATTPAAPAPTSADTASTGIGSLAGAPSVDAGPAAASAGVLTAEVGASGSTAPSAPASKTSSLLRRLAIPIVIFAVVVGGVVFRDRLSGSSGDLVVGDCFDAPSAASASASGVEVGAVQHHPCSEAHLYETFAVLKHPAEKGAPYPGIQVLFAYAETNCLPPFEAYVGLAYDASSLSGGSIVPKEDGWKDGQRSITCYLGSGDETPVTGSLKGSRK
jgi:hypothetical protein